jgi:BlaI family penicillinase repressor
MPRKKTTVPTEKEMQILSILWSRGASTVREVNTIMNRDSDTGYTTTLKLMQIMYDKGLLKRDDSTKTHVYFPANSEEQIQSQVVGNLLDRVFAGSTEKLMMRVLSSQHVTLDELSSLKKMIEMKEKEAKS